MRTKRIIKSALSCFLFIFQICAYSNAEIIRLKNGREIEGSIAKETKDNVVINVGPGMDVTIDKIDIESINEGSKNISSADNAAKYYLKAITLLKYPEAKEINTKLEKILKTGWQNDDKELEQLLKNNEPCIGEALKATLIENCDFDFGKKYKYEVQRKVPPVAKLRNLSYLLILKARFYERQGNFDKAIDLYLSLLTMARHISQNNTLVSKMIAVAIEGLAITPLQGYVNLKTADKRELEKIANYINSYRQKHFPAKDLVKQEKEFFISTAEMISNGVVETSQKNQNITAEKKGVVKTFAAEFMNQAHEFADRYYGYFATAAETNSKEDWQKALNELTALQKEADSNIFTDPKKTEALLLDTFIGGANERNRRYAKEILKSMLAVSFPNFEKAVDHYYTAYNGLKELQVSVSNKLGR